VKGSPRASQHTDAEDDGSRCKFKHRNLQGIFSDAYIILQIKTVVKKYFSMHHFKIYFLTFISISSIIYNMKDYQKRPWTHEERNLLRLNYHFKTEEELLELFPGRSINAIRKQVVYLKKRGWAFIRKGVF
jgi:hypothetical protein